MERSKVIKELLISAGCLAFFVLYLLVERILLSHTLRRIPLRICITGTRGKSSVTRLIAGALKEGGLKILAKTTGSKPALILPDGSEKEIQRRGSPSILEGKDVLRTAARHGARAVVAEMMSFRPESISVESAHIFRPHIVVITNIRIDHPDQMGESKEDVAECFTSAIMDLNTVFVPEKELYPVLEERGKRAGSKIVVVPDDAFRQKMEKLKIPVPFARDVQLTLAVAEFLNIDQEVAAAGMKKALPDFGSLRVWKAGKSSLFKGCLFVSAFAANEPESTGLVLDFLSKSGSLEGKRQVALLNFRKDRGDRTLQWLRALKNGFLSNFDRIALLGDHSPLIKSQMKEGLGRAEFIALRKGSAQEIIEKVVIKEEECVLIGMGNMAGMGREIVLYWEEIGEPYDL